MKVSRCLIFYFLYDNKEKYSLILSTAILNHSCFPVNKLLVLKGTPKWVPHEMNISFLPSKVSGHTELMAA